MSTTDPEFDNDRTCVWRGIEVEITADVQWATSWSTRERIADADIFCLEFPGSTADDDGAAKMIVRHWLTFHDEMNDNFSWVEDCALEALHCAADDLPPP